jgi:iron complex outermembrane receptor protein
VVSYRPTDQHTLYAKYTESFKAGGADGSLATFPTVRRFGDINPFTGTAGTSFEFAPEYAYHWELGAKGLFLDGRVRYDISAFDTSIKDLQIGTTQALSNNSFISSGNAGEQTVKGIEFATDYAATDRLTLSLNGVLMDNTMVDFLSTCTDVEFEFPELSGCDVSNSTIDRSGTRGANAPVWKFVLSGDYEMPVMDSYVLGLNAQGYLSDGYITDNTGFSKVNMMDDHGDLSITVSLGDATSTWKVSAFARNIFNPRTTYFPENDIDPGPLTSLNLDTKHFTTYGVKFRYDFSDLLTGM